MPAKGLKHHKSVVGKRGDSLVEAAAGGFNRAVGASKEAEAPKGKHWRNLGVKLQQTASFGFVHSYNR